MRRPVRKDLQVNDHRPRWLTAIIDRECRRPQMTVDDVLQRNGTGAEVGIPRRGGVDRSV